MEFITLRSLVVPSLCSGATAQGLRVINSIDPCVLRSNYLKNNTVVLIVYTLNKLADTPTNNNSNLKVYTLTDSVTFSI